MSRDRTVLSFLAVVVVLLTLTGDLFCRQDASPTALSPQLTKGIIQSHARAVRLCGVMGKVIVRRPGSAKGEPAVTNAPIQEGFELSSPAEGVAMVEFEHQSTALVGQHSKLFFQELALDASGNRLTKIIFEQGVATFHFLLQHHSPASKNQHGPDEAGQAPSTHADVYQVNVAEANVAALGNSRFRVDVKGGHLRVEVFKGKLQFATPLQTAQLSAGETLDHLLGAKEAAFNIHHGIVKDPWDIWAQAVEEKALGAESHPAKTGQQTMDLRNATGLRHTLSTVHPGGMYGAGHP